MKLPFGRSLFLMGVCALVLACGDGGDSADTSTPLDLSGNNGGNSTGGDTPTLGGGATDVANGTGDDVSPQPGNGSTDGSGSTPSGTGDGSPAPQPAGVDCDESGFSSAREVAGVTQFGIQYQAETASSLKNVMITQVYESFGGPTEPGTYSLDGINFRDCGLCLLMLVNCSESGNCEKTLYAEQGTVVITKLDSGNFAARYEDVVYREVTVSEGDSTSTIVPGGTTWCANGYEFDQPLQSGSSGGASEEEICNGPTACVGEEVSNFQVTSCATGEQVGMRDYFEGAGVGLLLGTAGWCGACSARIPQVLSFMSSNPQVKTAFLLGETNNRTQPDQRWCQQYARAKNIPLENIFIDHDGEYSHSAFFQSMWPYPSDGLIGLPYHAVVDPVSGEYLYGDGGPGQPPSNIIGLWR